MPLPGFGTHDDPTPQGVRQTGAAPLGPLEPQARGQPIVGLDQLPPQIRDGPGPGRSFVGPHGIGRLPSQFVGHRQETGRVQQRAFIVGIEGGPFSVSHQQEARPARQRRLFEADTQCAPPVHGRGPNRQPRGRRLVEALRRPALHLTRSMFGATPDRVMQAGVPDLSGGKTEHAAGVDVLLRAATAPFGGCAGPAAPVERHPVAHPQHGPGAVVMGGKVGRKTNSALCQLTIEGKSQVGFRGMQTEGRGHQDQYSSYVLP